MWCFQTEFYDVASVVLFNVTVAAFTALLPQYAFISFMAAVPYYFPAFQLFSPLCEWWMHYYAVYAAGGAASILAYIYAWNRAAEHVGFGGLIFILFTALFMSIAYMATLKSLLPSRR